LNKIDLFIYGVTAILGQYRDDYIRKLIESRLEEANGDIRKACDLIRKPFARNDICDSDSFTIGNYGSCGPGIPRVTIYGNLGANNCKVWDVENAFQKKEPDIEITLYDLVAYSKDKRIPRRFLQISFLEFAR